MANARKNYFYKNYYQTLILLLISAILIILALVFLILYQVTNRPLPAFTAIAPNSQTMALKAFTQPNLLPNNIIKWASKAAVTAYTFDFVNYNKQIRSARPFFTVNGWNDYQVSVYRLLQDIAQKQLFVSSVVSGTPVISNQGILPGLGFVWRVQLPFQVTYQSSDRVSRQRFYVMMTVMKVSTQDNPTGIGIDSFIMK